MFISKVMKNKFKKLLLESQSEFDDLFQIELDKINHNIKEMITPMYTVEEKVADFMSNHNLDYDELIKLWEEILQVMDFIETDISAELNKQRECFLHNMKIIYQNSINLLIEKIVKNNLLIDENYIRKQLLILDTHIVNKITIFSNMQFEELVQGIRSEMGYTLKLFIEYTNTYFEEEKYCEEVSVPKKSIKKKIFDYKNMNKLLLENGYEPIRQSGSHKIYFNKNMNKTTVVPQHKLGLGISYEIQKQIYT